MKGLVVAGTASGVGKTTLTLGLIAALRRRGLVVQPFKVGPDYIDPSYHTVAAGRPCRNLDSWMLPEAAVRELFYRATRDADLAIVEGVMGLFDGRSGAGEIGSTAHVARLLGLPVVLVLDAARTARSVAATALGFARFEPRVAIVGCLLNNVAGERHHRLVADAVEQEAGLPVLGWLGRDPELRLEERYLGLVPTAEWAVPDGLLNRMIGAIEQGVELDRLMDLAAVGRPSSYEGDALNNSVILEEPNSPVTLVEPDPIIVPMEPNSSVILREPQRPKDLRDQPGSVRRSFAALRMTTRGLDRGGVGPLGQPLAKDHDDSGELFPPDPIAPRVRIGVARDAAFSFYYGDNFDLLRAWGAELVDFSPLDDGALPPDLGGLYFGGGFPELFASRLAANTTLLDDVRRAAMAGMPIVAECGGLMYLGETLTDRDGRRHQMACVLPAQSSLDKGRLTLGYREVVALRDSPLLRAGESIRGHEFHWSESPAPPTSSAAYRMDGPDGRLEGFASDSLLASYIHVHFGAGARLAQRFVNAGVTWTDRRAARQTTVTGTDGPDLSSDVADGGPDSADESRCSPGHGSLQSKSCQPERSEGSPGIASPEIPSANSSGRGPRPGPALRCAQVDSDVGLGAPATLATTGVASSPAIIPGRLLRRHGYPPRETERLSMRRIVDRFGDRLPATEPERSLVARLVYAAGDPALIPEARWADGAIGSAVEALRLGHPLVVDVRMAAAGLDRRALDRLGSELVVAIDVPGAAELAARAGITRSAAGILALGSRLDGAVVAVGNAPTALLALLDLAESGVARPTAVLGFPVGFVAAAESKDELVASGLPYVAMLGTRGGSPLATAAVNFLTRLAASPSGSKRETETTDRPGAGQQVDASDNPANERHADPAAAR